MHVITVPVFFWGMSLRRMLLLSLLVLAAGFIWTMASGSQAHASTTVTVKSGDTLSGIAADKCTPATTWQKLARTNGISDPDFIRIGQKISCAGAKSPDSKPVVKKSDRSVSGKGSRVVAFAKKQIGKPYVYGAEDPSAYDCSGLTQAALKYVGVSIPRTSQAQFRFGTSVSKANLRPGDLVFFYRGITHVGIYAGNGNVIHAPRPGKSVTTIRMNYMPYQGARRY